MPVRIHLDLLTPEDEHRINADSLLTALDASLEILRELDSGISGGKFRWHYSHLSVGSGISVLEGEIADDSIPLPERGELERELESTYLNGLAAFGQSPRMPPGFTRKAAEAGLRMVSVLTDSVSQIVTYSPDVARVVVTERIAAVCRQRLSDFSGQFLMYTSVALSLPAGPMVVSSLM